MWSLAGRAGNPLDCSLTQLPRVPGPSMDTVDTTVEKLREQCLSRGASGIQGLAR